MTELTEREYLVLEALWERDGAELGAVVEALYPATRWNRNTVFTYLTRMEAKGLVSIDKYSYPRLYRAVPDRESCRAGERERFLRRVYGGDAAAMLADFLKDAALTGEERESLRALLDAGE